MQGTSGRHRTVAPEANTASAVCQRPKAHVGSHVDGEDTALFAHLYDVCAEAARRGDRGPAEALLRSYKGEVERLRAGRAGDDALRTRRDGIKRQALVKRAEQKAGHIAQLLGKGSTSVEDLPTSDLPTAQTVVHNRRRRRDPLANMRLTRRQEQAANEIRTIYETLVRALFAHVGKMDKIAERSGRPTDVTEHMSERVARLRHERYLPWAASQMHIVARLRVAGSPVSVEELSAVGLTITVLIDGEPLGRLEKRFGMRHGTLGVELRRSLDTYADIARGTASASHV